MHVQQLKDGTYRLCSYKVTLLLKDLPADHPLRTKGILLTILLPKVAFLASAFDIGISARFTSI